MTICALAMLPAIAMLPVFLFGCVVIWKMWGPQ